MSILGKVLIALLCALAAAAVFSTLNPELSLVALLAPTAVAALAAVLLSHRALPMPSALAAEPARKASAPETTAKDSKSKGRQAKQSSAKAAGHASRKGSQGKRDSRAKQNGGAPRNAAVAAELEEGTVKWFNVTKGYGFIVRGNGEEIFVHHRSVQGEGRGRLDDGAAVRFRVAATDKGPQAEDVQAI